MTESKEQEYKIVLSRGFPNGPRYIWSPYVTKVEFCCRVANVSYELNPTGPTKGPKGKIPYISLTKSDGTSKVIGDSTLIISHLSEIGLFPDFQKGLSPSAKMQDLSTRALFEDKLNFFNTRERWGNYYAMRDGVLWSIAYPMRVIVGLLVYRNVMSTLQGQGAGRYEDSEADMFRYEIWETLNGHLAEIRTQAGEKAASDEPFWYLGGSNPTEADATVFGYITSVMVATSCPDSTKFVKGLPAVMEYARRIHFRYFPDYEYWE